MTDYDYFERFLYKGWVPHWDAHPESSFLELLLIEPRPHKYLRPVLENMSCMFPNASMTILHSPDNTRALSDIVKRKGENNIRMVQLFNNNINKDIYSHVLTDLKFWQIPQAPKVLIFQMDTGIRHNSILRFMQYDYVGAPWSWQTAPDIRVCVGNGGLSLRSTAVMREIAKKYPYDHARDKAEDTFFAKHAFAMPHVSVPSYDIASMFSVERNLYANPMGFHQALDIYKEHTSLVQYWADEELDPVSGEAWRVKDAWVEYENGRIVNDARIAEWLNVGVGPKGLRIPRDTSLSCIPNVSLASRASLVVKAGDNAKEHRVPLLHNNTVPYDVVISHTP